MIFAEDFIVSKTKDFTKFFLNNFRDMHNYSSLFVSAGQAVRSFENNTNSNNETNIIFSDENCKALSHKFLKINGFDFLDELEKALDDIARECCINTYDFQLRKQYFIEAVLSKLADLDSEKYKDIHWEIEKQELIFILSKNNQALTQMNDKITLLINNNINVLSIQNMNDDMVSKTSNPSIGLEFFKIDDLNFRKCLKEKVEHGQERIYVKSRNQEEAIYGILHEISFYPTIQCLVVKDSTSWKKLGEEGISDSVLIPWFSSEEIRPIHNNINIFIVSEDFPIYNQDYITLRPRKIRTIEEALIHAGMDSREAYNLVFDTHGLFSGIRKRLASGLYKPEQKWLNGIPVKTRLACMLVGKWSDESKKDQEILEQLAGKKYESIISEIRDYTKGDNPFIIIVKNNGKNTYQLASCENTWDEMPLSEADNCTWKAFIACCRKVFMTKDYPLSWDAWYKDQNEVQNRYSQIMRKGILRTLLVKNFFNDVRPNQSEMDEFVSDVLDCIKTVDDWKYISAYSEELCEIAPTVFIQKLENELRNHGSLIGLFSNQPEVMSLEKNYIYEIMFAIETLFCQKQYVMQAIHLVSQIDNLSFKFPANDPKLLLVKAVNPYISYSALNSFDDKKTGIEAILKEDPSFWYDACKLFPFQGCAMVGGIRQPKYRECEPCGSRLRVNVWEVSKGLYTILANSALNDAKKWSELAEESIHFNEDLQLKLISDISEVISRIEDDDRILIEKKLRSIVYNSRFFADATWALTETQLQKYVSLLERIKYEKEEYAYACYFAEADLVLMHPTPYNHENYIKENEKKKEKQIEDKLIQFKKNNLDIVKLASICDALYENGYWLGNGLYTYYDCQTFNENTFSKLLAFPRFAKSYFWAGKEKTSDYITRAQEIVARSQINKKEDVITELYRAEAWYNSQGPAILYATEEIKKLFWHSNAINCDYDTRSLLKECEKYGTIAPYVYLISKLCDNGNASSEEIFDYFIRIKNMEIPEYSSTYAYNLERVFRYLQQDFIQDDERRYQLVELELMFFYILKNEDFTFLKYEAQHDPTIYADLISYVLKCDDGYEKDNKTKNTEAIESLYSLFYRFNFCPISDKEQPDVNKLQEWISKFEQLLKKNHQKSLLSYLLGKLLAYGPTEDDAITPCKSIMQMIEKYGDAVFSSEYITATLNKRGVYYGTDGEEESRRAENYYEAADKIAIIYPRTAGILKALGDNYSWQSLRERENAENEF